MAGTTSIPVLSYEALRSRLRTGHVILWQGDSLLSRAIRCFSEYSHASLVVRLFDRDDRRQRVYLVEALETGLELRHLSKRLAGYSGRARVWMPPVRPFQQSVARQFAVDRCADAIRYDYGGLIANILCRVSRDASHYICSEFVWDDLIHAGVVRATDRAPRPGDIIPWAARQNVVGDLVEFAPIPAEGGEA
jgi:hypothetical protein